MTNVNRISTSIVFVFLLSLSACVTPPLGRVDTRVNGPEANNQAYNPAIVIVAGAHRRKTFLGGEANTSLTLVFVPNTSVTQIVNGESIQREWFEVWVRGSAKVLSLPPGEYYLTNISVKHLEERRRHSLPRANNGVLKYGFSVTAGEVLNLGYVKSWYSRNDKSWLDITIEPQAEAAIEALRYKFKESDSYIARMKTRLLKIPPKTW